MRVSNTMNGLCSISKRPWEIIITAPETHASKSQSITLGWVKHLKLCEFNMIVYKFGVELIGLIVNSLTKLAKYSIGISAILQKKDERFS